MERKKRGFLVALCLIVVIVVGGIVTVRLLLTRERLIAMLIPRVEKAVNAKVSIGDVRVRFPFGFGVDIDNLAFEKVLPDTSSLSFSSESVTVRASLVSLIKRKPAIQAADVRGGAVTISKPGKQRGVKLLGLGAHVSMQPAGDGFAVRAKALIDSVIVSAAGGPPAVALEKIGFDGEFEGDKDLVRLVIKESRVSWEDLLVAKVQGEVINVKTAPRVALTIEGDEKPLAPIVERVKSFKLGKAAPAKKEPGMSGTPQPPVEVSGGTVKFSSGVEGLVREPLGMNVSFELNLKNLGIKAGDLASIGKLNAALKGRGALLAWQRLFPSAERPLTPAEIQVAWQATRLEGTVEISDGSFLVQSMAAKSSGAPEPGDAAPAPTLPIRVSALKARAEISGPDVKNVSGEFIMGSSPFTFDAQLLNILPAASELELIAKSAEEKDGRKDVPDVGALLDKMVNAPVMRFEVKGRSFDARPFEKPLSGAKEGEKTAIAAPSPEAASADGGGGGAGGFLFLKNTTFAAKLDSIMTREAVITNLEAKGSVRDGRIKIDPATFSYAGGKGTAIVASDLRKHPRIETKVDFSAEGVEAEQALGALSSLGGLVQGRFTVKSSATLVAGPGINPLMSLGASGSALSTKGTVSLEKFIEPLAMIQGLDVTPLKKLDFNEWSGSFVVKNGRFISDDWKINSSKGAWSIKGSFGFDGSLDYAVHAVIPPDVQALMKGIENYKGVFDLMRDKNGNLVLDIHIGGGTTHPTASLDLTRAKSKVQDRVIEGLKKKFLR